MSDHAPPPPPPSAPPATPPPPPSAPPPASPPPSMGGSTGGGSQSNPVMIVLSYLGLLALIPYLVEKDDQNVQWHAKHGLVLTGAWFAMWIALWVVGALLGDFLGCLLGIITIPLALGILVVHIVMIVKALNGQRFKLPGISDFADKF